MVLVYNNDYHYSGAIPLKKEFIDRIDTLTSLLIDCRILGDNLQNRVEDPLVKKVKGNVSE